GRLSDLCEPEALKKAGGSLGRQAERGPRTVQGIVVILYTHPSNLNHVFSAYLCPCGNAGSGLMGNSSASFMGTFLASSLGTPPSHPSHPSRPPSSPSSPSFRGGPHSSASQIWFPHSHEAPGYPRFSGSLAHTFLPMSHLDHHANSGVIYGQHRFYDTQKENFYLRGLPSQPPLISANHSLPPMSRAGSGHIQGSCSRDKDPGVGAGLHKGLKEGSMERGVGPVKDKERSSSKQEAKERQQQHHQQHHSHVKEHSQSMGKSLSACLHNGKMQNGDAGTGAGSKASMSSCGGEGTALGAIGGAGSSQGRHMGSSSNNRCTKEGVSGEMRISEQPSDCLERGQAQLHHSLSYSVPPPLHMGGFHCLQLHPTNPASHERGPANVGREPKVTGPTFVPSVADLGEKSSGPFQLGNPDCQGVGGGGGGGNTKDKVIEKNGGSGHHSSWHRKQQQDCSHPGPPPNSSPLGSKSMTQHGGAGAAHGPSPGGSCSLQRDGQKVARIRHQQHGRPVPDAASPAELNQGTSQELKRKMDMSSYGYSNSSGQHHHQQPPVPPWAMRPPHHMSQPEEEQRKSYMELGNPGGQHPQQQQQQPGMTLPPPHPPPGESSAMKSLLKYSNQQQPLLLSHKSPFGGLGNLKSSPAGGSCALLGSKQTLPSRKGPANDNERPDYSGRSRDMGEAGHGESEVRQPPVGIAVAVARQREPPCRSADGHHNSRQGRVHPSVKGPPRSMYPSDTTTEEERKRLSGEQIGLTSTVKSLLMDNKERVEFARIHPSNSCHGDLPSHLMVPGGASLQSGQLGDPSAHSTHHHWMPRTGSPSLWMTGHSYGIGHTALHQNLPPGFSAAMPGPLQPVLPLPQDPSAQLVVLPTEPPSHPASHHLDVMEQPGLWPPVYSTRGPPSHMQHPAVYSRSQFLRQQELYALQQHQQLQHQHQSHQSQQPQLQSQSQVHFIVQKRPGEPSVELEELISEPRMSKPAKPYSYNPPQRNTSPTGACAAHLSPCCQSPSLRPHPKSTPSTPCPAPSPAAAAPRSPAISPAPPQMPKGPESQDKRGEGQPLQDYPESLEPGKCKQNCLYANNNRFKCLVTDVMPNNADTAIEKGQSLLILNATCVQTAPKAQHAHLWFISNALTKTEVNLMNGFGRIKHEGTQCKSTQTFFSLSVTEEELLMFDLQSLATLATARALEMDSQEGCSAGLGRHFPTRRIFNLRRKCSWTPRNEPVCPAKGTMETMDGSELAMRVKLAELQRRYKEKQKELAKLQKKHDHHRKEETPRSPARRGPGRPRKRKPTLATGPLSSSEVFPSGIQGATAHWHKQEMGEPKHIHKAYLIIAFLCCILLSPIEDEEEEGSYDTDEGQDYRAQLPRDITSSSSVTGPSPSSVVKLEANQKARNKKQRQELYGFQSLSGAEGEVKVRKKPPCRLGLATTVKSYLEDHRPEGVRRPCVPRSKEARWGGLGTRGNRYRRTIGLTTFPTTSERLKRATRKSTMLRGAINKVRRIFPKGRAVSRLLESFAADEGFQMDGSSFSEEEGDDSHSYTNKSPQLPNCVLTKELLTDGLKVLVSKEDELLYAARVHTLDLPDIIVIDGERGNRPRIYSLEQLLQEAVLDVRPESETMLSEGTRVCAYWSERSRCLYPGYVSRGGSSDVGKQGGVMVEFDDGDRGKISVPNIRLLPPGYQIHCGESSPALQASSGTTERRSSSLEQAPISDRASDRPKGSGKKQKQQQQAEKANINPSPFHGWSSLANTKKRTSNNLFQFNGAPKKAFRGKEDDLLSLSQTQSLGSTPVKGLFSSSSFEVDSFSSIANGYSSFCTQSTGKSPGLSMGHSSELYGQRRRQDELVMPKGRKSGQEFLVKLDHEGVTSPKTKNSKALLLQGGSTSVSGMHRTDSYSHPVLLVKDNKKGCNSSYSDLDEEEEERRRDALTAAPGGLRTAGRFLSRFSVSSTSSGSSSSSSSGSISSSSLCSSDNDSSYSSEDEDSSTLMLQSCLSSHPGLLHPSEPSSSSRSHQQSFVAKAVAVSNAKGGPPDQVLNSKSLKRKECTSSTSKPSKDFMKKPRMFPDEASFIPRPKTSPFLAGRQMWRWSGNPTQRRGLKGKARKLFYKAIVRGRDTVRVGDCAVFLSAGRPNLPYVGRIENFWESWTSSMVVKVKWFYHPEETKLGKRHRDGKHALYQSCHEDENDVQTISHKCQVVSREEYECLTRNQKPNSTPPDLYYLAGTYDPTTGQLVSAEGVSILC
uniref:BAH domain-containing protein n=1 Tax=Mola mola TaxID=94237 RepID=A0A3Q3WBV4_MOLML